MFIKTKKRKVSDLTKLGLFEETKTTLKSKNEKLIKDFKNNSIPTNLRFVKVGSRIIRIPLEFDRELLKLPSNILEILGKSKDDATTILNCSGHKIDYLRRKLNVKKWERQHKKTKIDSYEQRKGKYVDWEWYLTDTELAKKMNLSKERIRQIRAEFQFPKSLIKWQRLDKVIARENLENLLINWLSTVDLELLSLCPSMVVIKWFMTDNSLKSMDKVYFLRLLKIHNVSWSDWTKVFPINIDWRLRNKDIADIWLFNSISNDNVKEITVSTMRKRRDEKYSDFRRSGNSDVRPDLEDDYNIILQQQIKLRDKYIGLLNRLKFKVKK